MNLYTFEVKSRLKSLLFWSFGILFMIGGGMGKYVGLNASPQELELFMDQIPEVLMKMFGFYGFDLTKAIGFYGIMLLYLNVMAAIHATVLGTDLLSKEERDHTAEFLMVKPMTRSQIITEKALAGLTHLLLFDIITWLISVLIMTLVAKGEPILLAITLIILGMLFIQLIFFSLGMMFSAIDITSRRSSGIASALMLSTYLLGYFTDVFEKIHFMRYLVPFKYFDANTIIATNRLSPFFILLSTAIVSTAMLVTYKTYNKRDLHL